MYNVEFDKINSFSGNAPKDVGFLFLLKHTRKLNKLWLVPVHVDDLNSI